MIRRFVRAVDWGFTLGVISTVVVGTLIALAIFGSVKYALHGDAQAHRRVQTCWVDVLSDGRAEVRTSTIGVQPRLPYRGVTLVTQVEIPCTTETIKEDDPGWRP